MLKGALSKVGGRGGGSATLAQGSLPNFETAEAVLRDLGFEKP
jgi:alanyl-tRNA synthetase